MANLTKNRSAAIFAFGSFLLLGTTSSAQETMPEGLIGKHRDEVIEILRNNDIEYQVSYMNTCNFHHTVIETDPQENQPFTGGVRFAEIIVTTGSAEVVPKLIGLNPNQARAKLSELNLDFVLRSTVPDGHWCSIWQHDGGYTNIQSQTPSQGTLVCPESEVTAYRQETGTRHSQMTDAGCL